MAVRLGHPALGITDHGNINGALAHKKACEKQGIIPIVGCEAYWRPDRHTRDKELRYKRCHLILIAKNLRGWHNLIRITSAAFADGFYQDPCIDFDLQERYSEGLIVSTSCVLGPLSKLIQQGSDAEIRAWIEQALRIHGDNLYFSIMPHDFDLQRQVNLAAVSLAREWGIGLIHEKDSHYPEAGWVETQKIAILTGINKTFAEAEEKNRQRIAAGDEVYELWHDDLHLSSEDEDRAMYAAHHPNLPLDSVDEAMRNTDDLLQRVEPYLTDRTLKMPRATKEDPRKIVEEWCYEGLERIGKRHDEVYEKQLRYEFEVVEDRNAWSYFALVGDVVRWARSDAPLPPTPEDPDPPKKRPIRINTRGSAAASLLCHSAQISTLDPIAHRFKFERFMNPERHSLPDVDLDIASSGRKLMKEYVVRKYGKDAVADVVAQQTWQPRAALLNVTKTMYGYGSEAYKAVAVLTHEDTGVIDQVHDTDLESIRAREPRLEEWASNYPEAWEHARRLENAGDPSILRLSKHAAAVVILPGEVTSFMPTIRASEDDPGKRTAWAETSKVSITEEVGVVKVDFLGLKGMDQQQMIVDMIAQHTGKEIDLDTLPPFRDPYDVEDEVMEIFRCGLTFGVNQFSGEGVTGFMQRAQPDNLVDLTAINAIYRPGPLGSGGDNRYVKRKHGAEFEIPEALEATLRDTYGCLVFQEQVMELFQIFVGYSAGQADDIRKEIDKLNRSKNQEGRQRLAARHETFVEAAAALLGSMEAAEEWWQQILPYTGYAFNRPHAGSYSWQAYQDGWLKTHYPLFTFAVLLTMEEKKAFEAMREARSFDVSVLPPDVNVSGDGFTVDVEDGAVRYGLRGIKGIGDAAAQQIMADRPFASLYDFETRSSRKYSKVNKKSRAILIKVGAFDRWGARDDGVLAWHDEQNDIDVYWDSKLRAQCELELIGITLEPGGILGDDAPIVRENVYSENEIAACSEGAKVIVGGAPAEVSKTTVKRGKQSGRAMGFCKLALDLDQYSLTMFPDVWDEYHDLIESGQALMVKGSVDDRGKIIAKQMMLMSEFIDEIRDQADAA